MPANAAKVPITACITMLSPRPLFSGTNMASMNLLNAPSATPSRAAKAITSGGLTTRLNELTIDSPKAPNEPTISAR